ncbi:ImuA family protein [Dongia sp.]|uniref:ImuA family protein n=1 Tax=Dongia sp. TaxID=1977262 RepID=UPI003750D5EF
MPPALAANQNHPAEAAPARVKPLTISGLRDQVARLERLGATSNRRGQLRPITLGLPELDRHLPWGGLPRAALHEVAGEGADREEGAAAAGFAALWLARLQETGPLLWIVRAGNRAAIDLHAHGLHQQELDPKRLILVAAKRDDEALWAMEEGLKAKSLGAVLGEVEKLDLTASRRLQLAAETGGVTAFVLRRWRLMERAARDAAQPIAAVTRWRVRALPSENEICWQVDLARCRGGRPNTWIMEKAHGSDELRTRPQRHEPDRVAPLSGDLAPLLGGRPLAAGTGN